MRADFERLLLAEGFAGAVPNTREANLRAIRMLLDGVSFYTFGIRAVEAAAAAGRLDEATVVRWMAEANGLGGPDEFLEACGRIAPAAAYAGLLEAAGWLSDAAEGGLTVAFGTGHPGSMLGFYQVLAHWLRAQGATVARGQVGAVVGVDWFLDYVGDVAVTGDGCGVLHGHSVRPMEAVIATCGRPIDLVVADHGHAGAALNAGIPTIAVMDTNDPALAVAQRLGIGPMALVPLYDNLPNATTERFAHRFLELRAEATARWPGTAAAGRAKMG